MKQMLIATLLCSLVLSGCGTGDTTSSVVDSATQIPTVNDVLDAGTQQEPVVETPAPTVTTTEEYTVPEGFGSYDSVDIDLTTLNSVMVYSQVYDMVVNPANYAGMTVKMHGQFAYYYEALVDTYYFGVVIQDATACCAQGIEFVLKDQDQRTVPDDYPVIGELATVVGVFTPFIPEESPDFEYYHLEEAEFITD